MIERIFIQVLGILAIGYHLTILFDKREMEYLNDVIIERFVSSIILGYSSLMVVMIPIGVFFVGHLDTAVYIYFAISVVAILRLTLVWMINYRKLKFNFEYSPLDSRLFQLLMVSLIGIMFSYLIMPERGWDALHFYMPNAQYFFFQDGIVAGLNPLSFYPTFKPPFNTLYLTYSFYVAKGMYANLHPFLLFLGTIAIIYEIGRTYFESKVIGLVAALILLFFPLMFYTMIEFAYYQELPVMFFTSSTLYYLLKITKGTTDSPLLFILSISMAMLSKLSGFAVLFMVFMSIRTSSRFKYLQYAALTGIGVFLTRKAMIDIYFGTGLLVLALSLVLGYYIRTDEVSPVLSPKKLIGYLAIPLLVGIGWMLFALQIDFIPQLLKEIYLSSGTSQISFHYTAAQIPAEILIEHGLKASFLASAIYIFTGSNLTPSLIFFKLDGIRRENTRPFLLKWSIAYLIPFYSYFAAVSSRYLIPIMVPLALLTANSLVKFASKLRFYRKELFFILVVIATNVLFLVPAVPISIYRGTFIQIFFNFHRLQFLVLSYAILFSMAFFKIFAHLRRVNFQRNKVVFIPVLFFLILPTVLAPAGIVGFASISDNYTTNELTSLYYRKSFQDLVTAIENQRLPSDAVILTINTPGLEYFATQPVLDLYLVLGRSGIDEGLRNMNRTQALDFAERIGIQMIVTVNNGSLFYNLYEARYADLALVQLYKLPMYQQVYRNYEFTAYLKVN